jgi:hypothetical protein
VGTIELIDEEEQEKMIWKDVSEVILVFNS